MSKFAAGIMAISLAVLTAADCADAQVWRRFTTADGLAGDSVYAMLESRHGTLWFGTDSGLSQFDELPTIHLSGMSVRYLLESSDGTIWAGTDLSGLHSYDGSGWQEHLSGMEVLSLLESQGGTIWAGTSNGLHSYDGSGWQEHLSGMRVLSLLESSDGTIWAGTEIWVEEETTWKGNGLHSYDGSRWQEHLSGMEVLSLLESSDGTIWAGTYLSGLRSYNGIEWQKHPRGVIIYSLLESSDGTIWAGTYLSGLLSYDGSRWQEHLSGISWIRPILESQGGTIWAGTYEKGLCSYDVRSATWHEHPDLNGLEVYSLLESRDGIIWVGTHENGLYSYYGDRWQEHLSGMEVRSLLESQDGTIWARTRTGLHSHDGSGWQEHLSGISVWSVLESQDGAIWVRAYKDDLYSLYSYYDDRWQEHADLSELEIYCILESQDGTIWAGTNDGLHSYDGSGWHEHPDLNGMIIRSLLESRDGTIWVGTDDGLRSYDGSGSQEHLSGLEVHSLLESQDGIIWARTSMGLSSYDGSRWQGHLSGMSVLSLLESWDSTIWAGAGDGLHSYDSSEWHEHPDLSGISIWSLLGSQDGTIWAGTYKNGLYSYYSGRWQELLSGMTVYFLIESRDGIIWTGTSSGIVAFRPDRRPPSIEITEPREQTVLIGNSFILVKWQVFDFETETRLLTYEFRIDEGRWQPISENSMMTPVMEDGDHTFDLRAIDQFSNCSEPDSLQISVDTVQPNVLISSPAHNAIVGGMVSIEGGVNDTDLREFRVEYAEGKDAPKEVFKLIGRSEQAVPSGVLAEWDASALPENDYTIKLTATDALNHTKDYSISVTLDNTPPDAKLISPREGSSLARGSLIIVEVSDDHPDRYTLEYKLDLDEAEWKQILTKAGEQETEVRIEHTWDILTITGDVIIRLTAMDAAGNEDSDEVSVKVTGVLESDKGGEICSSDEIATLSIPPRSLPADTSVTINHVPLEDVQDVQPAPDRTRLLDSVYDIGPEGLKLRSIKPATLQMKLPEGSTESDRRIVFFRWDEEKPNWTFLGGTLQEGKLIIGIAEFGRYALMEIDGVPELFADDVLFTCQPRVFSPERGDEATITFGADEDTSVTLEVYNVDGWLERELVSGETMRVGRNAVVWDGRDDDGQILPSGIYLIALTVGDSKVRTKAVVILNQGVR